ncbi:hypothetical protein RRG08_017890 [Elysia crispata]|uniref:Uncharacterized protein n=1 Tax=Elysia crispata TaxID=231223 RepID=A0AAE1CK75_9GAST|nr:hypothetical protein RRG08_017890 [Elysia crispata]
MPVAETPILTVPWLARSFPLMGINLFGVLGFPAGPALTGTRFLSHVTHVCVSSVSSFTLMHAFFVLLPASLTRLWCYLCCAVKTRFYNSFTEMLVGKYYPSLEKILGKGTDQIDPPDPDNSGLWLVSKNMTEQCWSSWRPSEVANAF